MSLRHTLGRAVRSLPLGHVMKMLSPAPPQVRVGGRRSVVGGLFSWLSLLSLLWVRVVCQRNCHCYLSAFQVLAINGKAILFAIKQLDALIDVLKSKPTFL